MNPKSVAALMADIELEDPLDLAGLAIDEAGARSLTAAHFCEIDERLSAQGLDSDARLEIMAAIAAHTMVENLALHYARLKHDTDPGEFRAWMRRYGMH